jgi:hypothetical protein
MIVPEALASTRIDVAGERVQVARAEDAASDDGAVTLLAAVVTRSGYTWQPRLLGSAAQ